MHSATDRARIINSVKICDTWLHVIDHELEPTEFDRAAAFTRALAEGPSGERHLQGICNEAACTHVFPDKKRYGQVHAKPSPVD